MSELGLREMAWPVLQFMNLSGQLRPRFQLLSMFRWILTAGSLVSLTILASVELVISASSQLGSALEIITILLTFLEMCLRIIYLSYHETQIRRFILASHYFPVSCSSFVFSEHQMRGRAMKLSRRTQLLFSGYVFFVLTGYLSLPFLPRGPDLGFATTNDITASIVNPARKRPLYIPMWLPVDIETMQSPGYELLVVWQAWSFVVLVCVFCAADCLLYTFIIFIVEGLKHLGRVVPGRKIHNHVQLPPAMFSADLVSWRMRVKQKRTRQQSEHEYRVWVQQHQFLLNLGKEIERLFSPIIFGTFLVNGAVLCVLAYVLVKLRNLVGILCVTGHFSCIVIKLYVMAKFGQSLSDESKNLGVESVSKVWPRLGENRRKDARIISLRCTAPLILTLHGFFDLTVETFGRVCSIALSYFIVLLQLH